MIFGLACVATAAVFAFVWRVRANRLRERAFHALAGHRMTPVVPPTIRMGDRSPIVKLWQVYLRAEGHCCVYDTGVFDGPTFAATCEYQLKHKLATDGIVGPNTWRIGVSDGSLRRHAGKAGLWIQSGRA